MPGLVDLVSAISDDVVAALYDAGLPPLVDGQILFGSTHIHEQSAAPRIVFVPVASKFAPKSTYNRSPLSAAGESDEQRLQRQYRSIVTEKPKFEVHVWGVADPPSDADDYDATQLVYQQVIRSVHLLAAGSYELSGGQWVDDGDHTRFGKYFTFGIELATPIPDKVLPYAPTDVHGESTVILQPADGSTPNPADAIVVNG